MRQCNNLPFSCIVVYSICMLYCSFAFASTSFEMPSLPLSVFADTEISSNLLFKTDSTQNRNWVFSIEADVSTNNNVQAEFGVDMDGNGVLTVNERELVIGWDCGQWVLKNRRGEREYRVPESSGRHKMILRLVLYKNQSAKSLSSVFHDVDISDLFNPEWNLVRIVVRGGNKPGESIKSIFFPHPFVLRLM